MKIAVTGAAGFLGGHVRAVSRALGTDRIVSIDREDFLQPSLLDEKLRHAEAVIHLAGVNRAHDVAEIHSGNVGLAHELVASLRRIESRIPMVFANSIQANTESPFGRAKREASIAFEAWAASAGAQYVDVLLPNLFGEGGRPNYNSVVATFASRIWAGDTPVIHEDRELPLLHAVTAAESLVEAAHSGAVLAEFQVRSMRVSDIARVMADMHTDYMRGLLPDFADEFARDLFNTFRSYSNQPGSPRELERHSDQRGTLFEAVAARGGQVQVFYSNTEPGFTRGNHFHLRKFERFLVVAGEAIIRMRGLTSSNIVEYRVSGEMPTVVDMPTLWPHSIQNVGDTPLTTIFYTDQIFDAAGADTYAEHVQQETEEAS